MAAAPDTPSRTCNPKARETARRRRAYECIDAAYFSGQISESARELAKWQLRVLCGMGTYFDTTQAEQARRFLCPRYQRHLSRRHIIRLTEEIEAAELIWRAARGTGYRTYITAYVPRPVELVGENESDAGTEPTSEVDDATCEELRQAVDQAMAAGELRRAAMLAYQFAMRLAQHANTDVPTAGEQGVATSAPPFFGAPNGDIQDTNCVTDESPDSIVKESDIPYGDVEPPVCAHGGDGKDTSCNYQHTDQDELPETEATARLRAWGVQSPKKLKQFSAAPLDCIDFAFRSAHEAGGDVGLGLAMLEHGVWKRGRKIILPHDVLRARSDEDGGKYLRGGWHRHVHHGLSDEQLAALGIDEPAHVSTNTAGDAPSTSQATEHVAWSTSDLVQLSEELHVLWQTAIAQIAVAPHEWHTWIASSRLLLMEDDQALIGVPNIFVRQELEHTYKVRLEAALSQARGQPTTIQVVISHIGENTYGDTTATEH